MLENLDALTLSRIQFAFTVSFHIIFRAFTIGLASWLPVLEWRWLKTGNAVYAEVYRMWAKIFAVTFGMGVVSGVVLSFQFGTNWSAFADKGGNVLGPLPGYEVLTAFFLEAGRTLDRALGHSRAGGRSHRVASIGWWCLLWERAPARELAEVSSGRLVIRDREVAPTVVASMAARIARRLPHPPGPGRVSAVGVKARGAAWGRKHRAARDCPR